MNPDLQNTTPVSDPPSVPPSVSNEPPLFSSHYAEEEKATLERAFAAGATWFYWIAGLSLINSLIAAFGGKLRFIFGLGITSIVEAIFHELKLGTAGAVLGFAFALCVAGIFVLFGYLCHQKMRWPFWVGMGLYVVDALLLILVSEWLSAAVHAYVLYRMWAAVGAIKKLSAMET